MEHVYSIWRDDLTKEAVKNDWSDHAVDVIEEIAKVWLDSEIAKSVLLFFREDDSRELHSYMPVVSKHQENVPNVKDFDAPKGKAKIIGIKPYPASLEASYYPLVDTDNPIITRIMKKILWQGHTAFSICRGSHITLQRSYIRGRSGRQCRITAGGRGFGFLTELPDTPSTTTKKPAAMKLALKVEKTVSALQELYSKRRSLDQQIADAQKKLASSAKPMAKPVSAVNKPAAKKPTAKPASTAIKTVTKKPASATKKTSAIGREGVNYERKRQK